MTMIIAVLTKIYKEFYIITLQINDFWLIDYYNNDNVKYVRHIQYITGLY